MLMKKGEVMREALFVQFFALFLTLGLSSVAGARDQIRVVGSSTVYPFSTIVAERFGKGTKFKTPIIESTGSGGGLKLFCAGVGLQRPDVTNASRRVKKSELELCRRNGVSMTEFVVGNDGLAFSSSRRGAKFSVSIAHIAAALAAKLPDDRGNVVPNFLNSWVEVDTYVAKKIGLPSMNLPDQAIRVLVPPPTSGTRDAMGALFMSNGHKKLGTYDVLGKKSAQGLREDGAAIEVGENDNLIVEKLISDNELLGIFGFSFYDQNRDQLQAADIDGVALDMENISSYQYPGSRPLYAYVKREHLDVIPGLRQFFQEFISEKAVGLDGYLFPAGLVPLSEEDFVRQRAKLKNFPALSEL